MSGNMEPERIACSSNISGGGNTSAAGKLYPMDLAVTSQKITIVKSAATTGDSKLHLVTQQGKPHLISHGSAPISLVRPAPQIISQGVASQHPQMIVSGSQLLSGSQVLNQGTQVVNPSQIISASGQIINTQPQIINQSGHILNQVSAQIMSQSNQIVNQGSHNINQGNQNIGQGNQNIIQGSHNINLGNHHLNQGNQIVSQGAQVISQGSQVINQNNHGNQTSQSSQISQGNQMSQGTQVISQMSQLTSQVSSGGTQVLTVGTPLISGGGVVVSSGTTLRTLSSTMRVIPPSTHSTPRPVVSTVTVTPLGAALTSKPSLMGVTSHVPRGPAVGASLAIPRGSSRPTTPTQTALPVSSLGGWTGRASMRGPALVYPARPLQRGPAPRQPLSSVTAPVLHSAHSQTQPATNVVTITSNVSLSNVSANNALTGVVTPLPRAQRSTAPLATSLRATYTLPPRLSVVPSPRPTALPVLQKNFQPTKVVTMGTRPTAPLSTALTRSALYYEVTRPTSVATSQPQQQPQPAQHQPTPPAFYSQQAYVQHNLPSVSMTVLPMTTSTAAEGRLTPAPLPVRTPPPAPLPRPTILRKRDVDGSPCKNVSTSTSFALSGDASASWGARRDDECVPADDEDGGDGGSTTVSAASSPAPDDEPRSPPEPRPHEHLALEPIPPQPAPQTDLSPRKKPRKQILINDIRNCEIQNEDPPPSSPAPVAPPPRRSMIGSSWSHGYRGTALHFTRPSEVRRRDTKPPHVLELANEKHVLTKANGWKVHHLTAQMEQLVALEAASCERLDALLRTLDATAAPHLHSVVELVKGNMQRNKIVCEDIKEAREDILRVFTHRKSVADILARQADKRCFRKHRATHT